MGIREHLADIYGKFPNWITLGRIVLTPFIIPLFGWEYTTAAFILFVFLGLTDLADGFLARHFHQTSFVGAVLDPFADKVFIWIVLFGAVGVPKHFAGLVWFAFALDITLVLLALWATLQFFTDAIPREVMGANIFGKGKFISLCFFVGSLILIAMGVSHLQVLGFNIIRPEFYIRIAIFFAIGSIIVHIAAELFGKKVTVPR